MSCYCCCVCLWRGSEPCQGGKALGLFLLDVVSSRVIVWDVCCLSEHEDGDWGGEDPEDIHPYTLDHGISADGGRDPCR